MTEKLKATIFDAVTKEVLEREFTADEIANHENLQIENQKLVLEIENKKNARESALAKLAALGLTEEEIAAL